MIRWALALLFAALMLPHPGSAERLRIAAWNTALSRDGPGLLLGALRKGKDHQIAAVLQGLVALDADVLILGDVDHDAGGMALDALVEALRAAGADYPHRFTAAPNRGVPSGHDLDGDGRLGEPEDALAFAEYLGRGGMAILSRHPILIEEMRDFTAFLWADLPGNLMPPTLPDALRAILPLSSTVHWEVPVSVNGRVLRLLVWHGTTPAFDGPEDLNGRRNHDETAFWSRLLAGNLPFAAPKPPFVVIGQANVDPERGDGRAEAIRALLANPRLQDALAAQRPSETVDYGRNIGPLRVMYALPSADLSVTGAGHGPRRPDASRHWPIWVDLAF